MVRHYVWESLLQDTVYAYIIRRARELMGEERERTADLRF